MILSFMKNDIKVFSAIYGDNWQSLNILTAGETFAQNIIVYRNKFSPGLDKAFEHASTARSQVTH